MFVKTIKSSIATDLFHTKNHFTYRRIRRFVQNVLFGGKSFAIFRNGFHVVVNVAMYMRMIVVMRMYVVGETIMFMVVVVCVIMSVFMSMRMMVVMVMIVKMLMIVVVIMVMIVNVLFCLVDCRVQT